MSENDDTFMCGSFIFIYNIERYECRKKTVILKQFRIIFVVRNIITRKTSAVVFLPEGSRMGLGLFL